jgi:hypothetical protein
MQKANSTHKEKKEGGKINLFRSFVVEKKKFYLLIFQMLDELHTAEKFLYPPTKTSWLLN